jgi:hypothetical protein
MARLDKVAYDEYDIIDQGEDRFHHIILKEESPFPDIVFQFGEVKLFEENNSLRVKFDYEIFSNKRNLNTNTTKFIDYIGNIMMTNLEELLFFNKFQRSKEESGI